MLHSLVATYYYQHAIKQWKDQGVDFAMHLYVPEEDPVTGAIHHERGDHNHILKRIGHHTRDGKNLKIRCEAFDEAMLDPKTG